MKDSFDLSSFLPKKSKSKGTPRDESPPPLSQSAENDFVDTKERQGDDNVATKDAHAYDSDVFEDDDDDFEFVPPPCGNQVFLKEHERVSAQAFGRLIVHAGCYCTGLGSGWCPSSDW